MATLPETEYNPDEKYQHPQTENPTRVLNESIPSIPTPTEQEQAKENTKETIQVPTSLIRWFCYSIFFSVLLTPFGILMTVDLFWKIWIICNAGAILGHFAGQLNKLIDK